MQQFVTLLVVCEDSGRHVFETLEQRIRTEGFHVDLDPLLTKSHLAFHLRYLDVWSMGDSFERFLYPKKELVHHAVGATELWALRREKLAVRGTPENEEEKRLKEYLLQARQVCRRATDESYFIMVRTIFDVSTGFNPIRTPMTE